MGHTEKHRGKTERSQRTNETEQPQTANKKKTEQHRPKTRAKTQTQFQKETLSTSSSVAPISEPLFLLLEKERTKKKQKGAYSRDRN
jgi:hypothetical protein